MDYEIWSACSLIPAECVCNIRDYHECLSNLYPNILIQMVEGGNEIRQNKVDSFVNIILPPGGLWNQ